MKDRKNVCFVSDNNTCRSIIAELYLRNYGRQYFEVQSFGITPDRVHYLVSDIMAHREIDPNYSFSKAYEVIANQSFDYIVLMHPNLAKQLPEISSQHELITWNFAKLPLSTASAELTPKIEALCDKIEKKVEEFMTVYK